MPPRERRTLLSLDLAVDLSILSLVILYLVVGPCGLASVLGLALYAARVGDGRPLTGVALAAGARLVFRYVTRGDKPDVVRASVDHIRRQIRACPAPPAHRIEVVTRRPVDVEAAVMLVPPDYETRQGARYKARSLHYAVETSPATAADWIVHLDEETVFDAPCVEAIVHFVNQRLAAGDADDWIGQGAVIHGGGTVENHLVTWVDSIRVAWNIGPTYALALVRRFFAIKGSFWVMSQTTERRLSWDLPEDLCLTEDDAVIARYPRRLRGDWIAGYMMESSPLSLADLARQRRRWVQGQKRVVRSRQVPLARKLDYVVMILSQFEILPALLAGAALLAGIRLHPWILVTSGVHLGMQALNYGVGAYYNFRNPTLGRGRRALLALAALVAAPLLQGFHAGVYAWGFLGPAPSRFEVVDKPVAAASATHEASGPQATGPERPWT